MKKYKNWIYVAGVILAIFILWKLFLTKKNELKINYTTAKIERGDVNVNVTATGTLSADTTVTVGTQVSGIISKIYVDFNSKVKKGQVIAELDKTPLMASLTDAAAQLQKARASTSQAKRDLDRYTKLLTLKVVAQADYDQMLATYEVDKAAESSMKAELDRAQISLNYATIYAPINGVVIQRSVDVGQTVAASFNTPTLFIIAKDLTKMQVQASVDEADIGLVKLNQQVTFSVDAYQGDVFTGTVSQIRLQPTTVQNVVTYTVVIDVPNKEKKLMPGMTANITIHIQSRPNVLRVQGKALRFNPPKEYYTLQKEAEPDSVKPKVLKEGAKTTGYILPGTKHTIWLKEGQKLRPVEVTVGISDGNYTEITGDVKEGQEAVMSAEVTGKSDAPARSPFMPSFGTKKK